MKDIRDKVDAVRNYLRQQSGSLEAKAQDRAAQAMSSDWKRLSVGADERNAWADVPKHAKP